MGTEELAEHRDRAHQSVVRCSRLVTFLVQYFD